MIKEFLKIVSENPDLPIVAMVGQDVVGCDDYRYWLGSIGHCRIDEYAIDDYYGDGCVRFKDDADILIEGIAECKYDGTDEDYKRAEEEVKTMWKKAIVLYIESWEGE